MFAFGALPGLSALEFLGNWIQVLSPRPTASPSQSETIAGAQPSLFLLALGVAPTDLEVRELVLCGIDTTFDSHGSRLLRRAPLLQL